tara:strand:+ start:9756 stop:10091 length:336 start_codon:yes stop_codon:yes gene_type:complete
MPIYEYECQKCDSTLEAFQKINDPPLKKCDNDGCNGKLRRLMSNSSFVLKGSGWYVTDYPSEARKKGMESEKKTTVSKKDSGKKASGDKASGNGKKTSTSKPAKNKKVSTN